MTSNHSQSNGTTKQSTRQLLVKIPHVSNLYRHSVNGTYYGIKKHCGKRKEHSLDTTDRKTAERKLAEWIKGLGKLDPKAERTTLTQLIKKFNAANVANPDKSTDDSMIKRFKETWKSDLSIRVSNIKPSMLDTWLATESKTGEWRNTTYNKYCTFFRRLFKIASDDKMIPESPMDFVKVPWKRPQKPKRFVPTLGQFAAIVADIRAQKFNAEAEDSADFIEVMGNAGLGQAEIKVDALKWDDVNWSENKFWVRRQKTQEPFDVPIYPNLKPVLERLAAKRHKLTGSVLRIADAKKALAAACVRLGYVKENGSARFSQRNIRAVQIRRLWQDGVDIKLIARWQGLRAGQVESASRRKIEDERDSMAGGRGKTGEQGFFVRFY